MMESYLGADECSVVYEYMSDQDLTELLLPTGYQRSSLDLKRVMLCKQLVERNYVRLREWWMSESPVFDWMWYNQRSILMGADADLAILAAVKFSRWVVVEQMLDQKPHLLSGAVAGSIINGMYSDYFNDIFRACAGKYGCIIAVVSYCVIMYRKFEFIAEFREKVSLLLDHNFEGLLDVSNWIRKYNTAVGLKEAFMASVEQIVCPHIDPDLISRGAFLQLVAGTLDMDID